MIDLQSVQNFIMVGWYSRGTKYSAGRRCCPAFPCV